MSTCVSNEVQMLHDKHSKMRSKRELHDSNKIADLEEIASLDKGVSITPFSSLSRASSK